jgi:hypothetical protein
MINVDPDTAQVGTEPLLTLYTYRRAKGQVLFGRHMSSTQTPERGTAINDLPCIRVNDPISILIRSVEQRTQQQSSSTVIAPSSSLLQSNKHA